MNKSKRSIGEKRAMKEKDSLYDFLHKIRYSRELWNISCEIAETALIFFFALIDYCKEKNIPIDRKEPFMTLMKRIRHLFKLVETLDSDLKSLKLPFNDFDDRDPEELPEPVNRLQHKNQPLSTTEWNNL